MLKNLPESLKPIQLAPIAEFPQFIDEIATLSMTEWGDLFAAANVSREQFMASMHQRINANQIPLTTVAIIDGQLAGYGSIKASEPGTKEGLTPWLAGIYVKQNYREKGIGKVIVQHLEEKARHLGFSALYLSADNAEHFYLKLGWQTIERLQSYGSREVALMRKDLR